MSCFLSFLVLLAFVIFLAGMSAKANDRARTRRLYQQLAKRFAGVYVGGGWWQPPCIRFRYGATFAVAKVIDAPRRERGSLVIVQVDWPEDDLRCEVFTTNEQRFDSPFSKMPEIEVGDEGFDRHFCVRGKRRAEVQGLLSRGVQWQLEQLRKTLGRENLYVEFSHGKMQVSKHAERIRIPELEQVIQRTLDLYDQAMLARSVGIEFVEQDSAQLVVEAKCQVCGDDVVEEMVICQRCKTPHHRDCWQYFGSCSTYGCQEKQYSVPNVALPVTVPEPSNRDSAEPTS